MVRFDEFDDPQLMLRFRTDVDSLAFGTITNSATVVSQMTDPDLLDNQVFRQADVLGND